MAKKKEEEAPAGSPAWMATFSDLMNLLLCFFVLLFSMSSVDAAKYDQVVQSLSAAFSIINTSGGVSITQGQLISSGLSQLPELANYFGDTMSNGKNTKEGAGEEGTGTMGEDESEEHGSTDFSETGISPDGTMTDGATAQDTRVGGGSAEMQQDGGANPQAPLSSETMSDAEKEKAKELDGFTKQFDEAMDDDINTADAFAAVFDLVRFANSEVNGDSSKEFAQAVKDEILMLGDILGMKFEKKAEVLDSDIEALIEERQAARKAKNFARADEIRDQLAGMGITLLDTREGVKWKRA